MDERHSFRAPGRADRRGISLVEFFEHFPDDAAAEAWFEQRRWPNRVACPRCGSISVSRVKSRKPMPWHCKDCRKYFSVKYGTVMQSSRLGLQTWLLAVYLMMTNLKGISSMKLHRDLGVTQKTAWYMAHRLREGMGSDDLSMFGASEADETYVGGKEANKHKDKRMKAAGGPVGKAVVAGVRERGSGRVAARVIPDTSAASLTGMVKDHVGWGETVYTDEAKGYLPLKRHGYGHRSVRHSAGQYVDGMAHTNGIESFWAMLKRGYHGTFHQVSHEHLHRYVSEFSNRHNIRPLDTINQMGYMVRCMDGQHLPYKELIADGPRARSEHGKAGGRELEYSHLGGLGEGDGLAAEPSPF